MRRGLRRTLGRTAFPLITAILVLSLLMGGCSGENAKKVKLDPKNPVTISVWHYYNGAIMNAFESMISSFNDTIGLEEGIIVEDYGFGSVAELEKAVVSSSKGEVGSFDMPNIFASYADTAYQTEKMGLLANLDDYLSEEEQSEFIDSYIAEGRIGVNGELRIFPIAKSTETLMLNHTDWLPFAAATGVGYGDLSTIEGVTRVAKLYYEWSDSLTPDVPDDGRAFFGRDSMANLFVVASKQFGTEIFYFENGSSAIDVNREVMRKIWDNFYVPYISGYFYSYGRFRSDDARVGDIVAYVGSTSSAAYFPNEVTANGKVYLIDAKVLPVPAFEGAKNVMVQQGAGMVVMKKSLQEEYASTLFLKWFTELDNNIAYSAISGYLPVKKEANDYDVFMSKLSETGHEIDDITGETIKIAFEGVKTSEMYTNKAIDKGADARTILEHSLHDMAIADRQLVEELINGGTPHSQAVAQFNTDERFYEWLESLEKSLDEAIK